MHQSYGTRQFQGYLSEITVVTEILSVHQSKKTLKRGIRPRIARSLPKAENESKIHQSYSVRLFQGYLSEFAVVTEILMNSSN